MNQTDQFNVKCGDQTPDFEKPPHCSDEEIEAIGIALKMKKQIVYGSLTDEQEDTCCHEKETE